MKKIGTLFGFFLSVALCAGPVKPDVTYTKIVKLVDMKFTDEVEVTYQYAAIVWNARGAELSKLMISYNKHVVVEDIEGAQFDFAGNKLRGVRSKEIQDRPAYDGFSLFSDARVKSHQFHSGEYPYRIYYSYTLKLSHNMYGISFNPRFSPSVAVDSFIGNLIFPKELAPNYRMKGGRGSIDKSENKDKVKLTYTVTNLKAEEAEPYSPPFGTWYEALDVFCNQCSYGGFKASAADWKGYGELIVELNEGRDVLSPALVNELTEITKNESQAGKVKKIYEYLQNNTRYISVQVGVGGIQPIPANEVYANGYGDCKGLSNLMKAMLSAIGIKSNYVLVEAGENPDGVDNSFIYDPFNHAILCVPFQHDTTWLECTSRFDPCGYQGGFTGNRKALVIEKGNSHLVSTNSYDHNDNTATASLMAKLEEGGDLQVDISMICRNESQDLLRQLQHEADPSIKERYWQSAFSLPSYVVNRVVINAHKEQAVADVDLKLTVSKAVSVSGPRMFMTPVFTNTVHEKLLKDTARVNDLYFNSAFTEIDTFLFSIPEAYRLESGGKTLSLSNEFGSFEMRTEVNNGTLTITRKRIQYRGTFDKTKFNDFVKFNNDMYQAERTKLVWVKN